MQPASVSAVDLTKSQRLSDLIRRPISSRLVQYVTQQAGLVIPCHAPTRISRKTQQKGEEQEIEERNDDTQLPPLPIFIQSLIKRSCVKPGTILGALVFLDRLQRRLAHLAKGMPCTCHRIFLATLIVTSKSLHDTSPKNKHWARYAIYFNLSEINLMEQQLLSLMNYQLIITPEEIDLVFIQYEVYKSQHQRHQQILPTLTANNRNEPSAISTTTHHHPIATQPILPVPKLSCAHQQTMPVTMEPRYVDLLANSTNSSKKIFDTSDAPATKTGPYPSASLFSLATLSSTSLSSGCSTSSSSLCTPSSNTSLTSLNLSSSSLSNVRTPCSSSECIILPATALAQTQSLPSTVSRLEQEPVLFYPPAHIHQRDGYRSSSSTTTTTTTLWNSMVWQKPPTAPAPQLDNNALLSQDPDQEQQQQQQKQQLPLWTTASANNLHPL